MTTIKDIARKTGFSVSTVSRALNNTHVDEETRRTILECAEKLDYHPNYNAQSLKVKKSRTIAYLIPDYSGDSKGQPCILFAVTCPDCKRNRAGSTAFRIFTAALQHI